MKKEKKPIVFKAIMVRENTHKKVIVKAKQKSLTVDKYINELLKYASTL